VDVAAHGVTEGTFVPNIAGVAAVVTEQSRNTTLKKATKKAYL
jgi:hypothetical protein